MSDEFHKTLDLTLDEARLVYLSTQKMGAIMEKDYMKKKYNEGYASESELRKLRDIHELNNKLRKFINRFLVEIQ